MKKEKNTKVTAHPESASTVHGPSINNRGVKLQSRLGVPCLQLVLSASRCDTVKLLEVGADAACLRAKREHSRGVGLALAIERPCRAVLLLVLADDGANTARLGAERVHVAWVAHALIIQSPDSALRGVLVLADCLLADGEVTRVRASFEGVGGVVDALAHRSPARAVVVGVLAGTLADAARDRAVHVHVIRVLDALTIVGPVVAVSVEIGALRCTEAACSWAILVHVARRRLALAGLCPGGALLVQVSTGVRAHTAGVGAELLDVHTIDAVALTILGPN